MRSFIPLVFCAALLNVVTADFRRDALDAHNKYRSKHGAPPLSLSDELNNVAQNWAQKMANSNRMSHSLGKYGENVFMSTNVKMTDSDAAVQATTSWYNEYSKYNYKMPGFAAATGHFTQVVWKDSKYLGIGVARSAQSVYVCGNYNPPGNYVNEFRENVLPPKA